MSHINVRGDKRFNNKKGEGGSLQAQIVALSAEFS